MASEKINDLLLNEFKKAAKEKGIDPALIRKEDLTAEKKGNKIHIKWNDVEIDVPAPSQEALDSWFKENGQVIAGAVLTLGAVAVGGVIAIAAAATLKD
nr:hypothetical protein [uncultured Halomonas sp.]